MSESDRVKRLQEAIEGECDGLAIDEAHARAILEYVDGETEPPAALQSALAECRDAMPIPEQGSRLEVLWGAAMGSPLDVPAYVRATMAAPQDQTPAPSAEGVRQ